MKKVMQSINLLRKTIGITASTIALSFLPASFTLAQPESRIAQAPDDLYCYFETSDGRILNINQLCGDVPTKNDRPTIQVTQNSVEARFLENFRGSLTRRTDSSPGAINEIQKNPQALVNQAKQICQQLQAGRSLDNFAPQGEPKTDTLYALAPKYFCPEFHD
jgi:hypothetical protein